MNKLINIFLASALISFSGCSDKFSYDPQQREIKRLEKEVERKDLERWMEGKPSREERITEQGKRDAILHEKNYKLALEEANKLGYITGKVFKIVSPFNHFYATNELSIQSGYNISFSNLTSYLGLGIVSDSERQLGLSVISSSPHEVLALQAVIGIGSKVRFPVSNFDMQSGTHWPLPYLPDETSFTNAISFGTKHAKRVELVK